MTDFEPDVANKFRSLDAVEPPDFSSIVSTVTESRFASNQTAAVPEVERRLPASTSSQHGHRGIVLRLVAAAVLVVVISGLVFALSQRGTEVATGDNAEAGLARSTTTQPEAAAQAETATPPEPRPTPELIALPALVDLRTEDATSILEALGIDYEIDRQVLRDELVVPDRVLGSDPESGSTVEVGSTVVLRATPLPQCGADLPVDLELVNSSLALSERLLVDQGGALVREIELDSGDLVSVRWPAGEQVVYDLSNGVPKFSSVLLQSRLMIDADRSPTGGVTHELTAQGRFEVPIGPDLVMVVPPDFDGPTSVGLGCETLEINVEVEDDSARFGWDITKSGWTPDNPWPIVDLAALVTSTEMIQERPTSIAACQGGLPEITGEADRQHFESSTEALADFLSSEAAETFSKSGYHEMTTADGSRMYGIHFDFLDRAPRSTDEFVVLITATSSEDGWQVTDWNASGC